MRGEGGQKMSVFVHAQGIKTVHVFVECPLIAITLHMLTPYLIAPQKQIAYDLR